jgi:hypothetical protein
MTRRVWRIYWDNGGDACGTFPWDFDSEAKAQAEADRIAAENIAEGVWSDEGGCEILAVDLPDAPTEAEAEEAAQSATLRRAALGHDGQP